LFYSHCNQFTFMSNNTKRFSNRVDDYVKYRPGYPATIINYLQDNFALTSNKTIADIGAGTGILTALFLDAGYTVWAIEPNKEMREKSVELLKHYPTFISLDATAENITLPANSIDAIIAGQAFHWFDVEKSKASFKKILKQDGLLVLIWNERKTSTPFEIEYDNLIIKHGKDYVKVNHRNISDKDIQDFFYPKTCALKVFENHQVFDFDGLKGRLLSSSYMPAKDTAGYKEMLLDLVQLFKKHEKNNNIRIDYDTKVYTGKL
jgi:SAM-dependent methyltransferase